MNMKKFIYIFMSLIIMFASMDLAFASAESEITFRVSTSDDLVKAVRTINDGKTDAKYVIEMSSDIVLTERAISGDNATLQLKKGITTIYGNNFALSSDFSSDSVIFAAGNSVINLGSADKPEKSKLFLNGSNINGQNADLLGITGSATVNVYDGVVFQNNSAIGRPGGAISVGEMDTVTNAKLNMYGGIIRNCKDTFVGYGGAIFVGLGAEFAMYNGTIENNTANGYGGAVCSMGTFSMTGGVIQNNTAGEGADDIFSQGATNITVDASAANGFGVLTSTNKQISGWFEDGNNEDGSRWDVNDYCVEITAEEASAAQVIALKAAHNANADVKVTFNTNSGVWTDTTGKFSQNTDNTYSENLSPGAKAALPAEPTKTGYAFLGWFTEDDSLYNFDSAVTENITLYAKWSKKMEPLNVIPTINASDKTLTVGDTFEPLDGVTASDKEDGDITKDIEVLSSDVDTSKAGTYTVTYKVTDSKGASSTKTITVTVKAKDTQKPTTDDNKKQSATDTDKKPASTDKQTTANSPKTGDSTNMTTWLALMFVSFGLLAGVSVRKSRKNR